MLAKIFTGSTIGVDAYLVEVEVDISRGLPYFSTVGLPDSSVKESKDRVRSAVKNSGYTFPAKKITVNLAPAHIKKEGTTFDLPVAVGILMAEGFIKAESLEGYLIVGELSLDGRVRPVRGALSIAELARSLGKKLILPMENAEEAALVEGAAVYAVETLSGLVEFVNGDGDIGPTVVDLGSYFKYEGATADMSEVKGQTHVKRALEVAAAGGHNLLMIGPPGSGKTMLARRIPTILPDMTAQEAIETTKVHSVAGMLAVGRALVTQRPFRSPHHTISDAGLIGGGRSPRPGEVSLAHNGVLFLDELPEFKKNVLEVLRQPMEDRSVVIARAAVSVAYPAGFMLVGAMNPCPCGFLGDSVKECRCTPLQVNQYRAKLSGPLLDRIDIHLDVPSVRFKEISGDKEQETSEDVKKRVDAARRVQSERYSGTGVASNSGLSARMVKKYCEVDPAGSRLLETAVERLGLSVRAYTRILKVARTIADLEGADLIIAQHLSEAIQYRTLDRQFS